MKQKGEPRFFYGWVIVAVAFVTLGITFAIWYSFSVFFLAIIKDFGWSKATGASIFSVFIICQALMALLAGHLQDRFGPRVVIPVGSFLLALSLGLTSLASGLWHLYFTYGLLAGASVGLIGFASHAAFIPNWFERKRGLAIGIAMSGIGVGMLFLIPIIERMISHFGWRHTYLILAGVAVMMIGPVNLIFSRRKPEDLGLKPDGDASDQGGRRHEPSLVVKVMDLEWAGKNWTLKRAFQTRRFWYLVAAFFCGGFVYQSTLLHGVSAMMDGRISRESAAFFLGILGIAGSGGKILFGYLSDRFGREPVNSLAGIVGILGLCCLIFIGFKAEILALGFALLFGLGYGAAAPMFPSVSADIFLGRSFGLIFSMICVGGGMGGATGPFLTGYIRDISGNYTFPLIIFIISLSLSCTFIWLAGPRKVRKMVKT